MGPQFERRRRWAAPAVAKWGIVVIERVKAVRFGQKFLEGLKIVVMAGKEASMEDDDLAEVIEGLAGGLLAGGSSELGDEGGFVVGGGWGAGRGCERGHGRARREWSRRREACVEFEAGGVEVFTVLANGTGAIAVPTRTGFVGEMARIGAGATDGDGNDGGGRIFREMQGADAAIGVVGAALGPIGRMKALEPGSEIGAEIGVRVRLGSHEGQG